MRAMLLRAAGDPLVEIRRETPQPQQGEVLIEVSACAICRTDLHIVDGDLTEAHLPIIPGHEIVGRIVACGEGVDNFAVGTRVGVPWLGFSCGTCANCIAGRENLCSRAGFTGYQIDGGFATHCIADAKFCFSIPDQYSDDHAAPLLCAGLIGYRAWRMAGPAKHLGIYGFGAAGHLVAQMAASDDQCVYAFTRPGDDATQAFARSMGVSWAASSLELPPTPLDAAIIFAPVGDLVPMALRATRPGGTVVLGGIHMTDIPKMPYHLLWGERVLRSVANLTRQDARDFFSWAARHRLKTTVTPMPLASANAALSQMRDGAVNGAIVLVP